jgi:prepilin-type N-terminal cleavage/methylation domain-containing protein
MSRRFAAQRGFTLIELLLAMVMLAVGVLAVGRGMTQQTRHSTRARYLADMAELADGKLEELRLAATVASADSSGLKFGGSTTISTAEHCDTVADARGVLHVRRWSVAAGPVNSWTRVVTVQVVPMGTAFAAEAVQRSTLILLVR